MVAITGTLIVQIVVFLFAIWLLKRWLWGPLMAVMDERKKRVADGIAAAEKSQKELEQAEARAAEAIEEARHRATEIIDNSNRRGREIVEAARDEAEAERTRELNRAREEIEQASRKAREELRGDFARIAAAAAGRILEREIDPETHTALVEQFAEKLFNGG